MKLNRGIVLATVAVMLSGAMLFSVASAAPPTEGGFSALQGVDGQALSVEELKAISGELNAYDIAAALEAKAATLGAFPKLQAATLQLAAFYRTNAVQINAAFAKLGVLTACLTCP